MRAEELRRKQQQAHQKLLAQKQQEDQAEVERQSRENDARSQAKAAAELSRRREEEILANELRREQQLAHEKRIEQNKQEEEGGKKARAVGVMQKNTRYRPRNLVVVGVTIVAWILPALVDLAVHGSIAALNLLGLGGLGMVVGAMAIFVANTARWLLIAMVIAQLALFVLFALPGGWEGWSLAIYLSLPATVAWGIVASIVWKIRGI
jgi:hypothetical protein